MPDLPSTPQVKLDKTLVNLMSASHNVRKGIATHAQKHITERHARREKLQAERTLQELDKPQ